MKPGVLFILTLALLAAPAFDGAPACAAEGVSAPTAAPPAGESYWGPIPARAESTSVLPEEPPAPPWTYPLLVPYRVVTTPLGLFFDGVGAGVVYLDDTGVIPWLAALLGPRQGPFGLVLTGRVNSVDGVGGGIGADHDAFFGPGNRLKARINLSTRGTVRTHLGVFLPGDGPTSLELGAGYRVHPAAHYYGIGPATTDVGPDGEDRESYFTMEATWAGATVRRFLGANLEAEFTGMVTAVGARAPLHEEEEESLRSVYRDAIPFGYGDRSDGVNFGAALIHDDTEENGRPQGSGVRRLEVSKFTAIDASGLSYWTFRGVVEHFVPHWHPRRALAIRGVAAWIETSDPLPFQRLYTNDEPDYFRGYRDFRWRDRGLVGVALEYRWPVWAAGWPERTGVDAYLLTDVAQVFGGIDEIAARNLTFSYGGGLRLIGRRGFIGRIEVGFSEEDTVFRIKAHQVFQYDDRGLYHGRDPVPLR